jgi:hypothetical protein
LSPRACRARRTLAAWLSSRCFREPVQIRRVGGHQRPPTSASRSTTPNSRYGRRPSALPVLSGEIEYAGGFGAEESALRESYRALISLGSISRTHSVDRRLSPYSSTLSHRERDRSVRRPPAVSPETEPSLHLTARRSPDCRGLSRTTRTRRRAAAARRAVLDRPLQSGTLQPPRDVRFTPTMAVGLRPCGRQMLPLWGSCRGATEGVLNGIDRRGPPPALWATSPKGGGSNARSPPFADIGARWNLGLCEF